MTAKKYIPLLEKNIVPYKDLFKHFQHDNAPCHKAKSVIDYMSSKDLNPISWPPYSPDLNPIENIWAVLKQKLSAK